jgi:hypothetical protein
MRQWFLFANKSDDSTGGKMLLSPIIKAAALKTKRFSPCKQPSTACQFKLERENTAKRLPTYRFSATQVAVPDIVRDLLD